MTAATAPQGTEQVEPTESVRRESRRERLQSEIAEYDAASAARRDTPAAALVAADYAMFE